MLALVAAAVFVQISLVAGTVGVAGTPPMGWNSWNTFGCQGISDPVVRATADNFVNLGLHTAGYEYVNMDDCWMLADRPDQGAGPQVPNPSKFPDGLPPVIAYVHSKNLKFGLYTARSSHTCAGFAASCQHEGVDAQQYADWLVDYVKDDSCGECRNPLEDYRVMQASIDATGHRIVLSVEGMPDVTVVSKGGHGNLRRVGHDINAQWTSMTSLVDIGSGLYPYAHNDSGTGGWWNDLDMLELGNGDFNADAGAMNLQMARSHFSMWAIMKAPLLLGNDLTKMGPLTLATITNKNALAINQDPLGVQGRRYLSVPAPDQSIQPRFTGQTILGKCSGSAQQLWRLKSATGPTRSLFMVTCDASDPYQQWESFGSTPGLLKNVGANLCVDDTLTSDPAALGPCDGSKASQQWHLDNAQHAVSARGTCLDVYDFSGPAVEYYGCKAPGQQDDNQRWLYNSTTKRITSYSPNLPQGGNCLSAAYGPSGYQLATTDAQGKEWCMNCEYLDPSGCAVADCASTYSTVTLVGNTTAPGVQPFTFMYSSNQVGWDTSFGASGPVPHSRYLSYGGWPWMLDYQKALNGPGSTLSPKSGQTIIDDDCIGNVTDSPSDAFCLELNPASNLEVWAGPLTGGRWAVALFNRSPSAAPITARWALFTTTPAFALFDVWGNQALGTFRGSFTGTTPAYGVMLLIATPAA